MSLKLGLWAPWSTQQMTKMLAFTNVPQRGLLANGLLMRLLGTFTKTKNVINCGVNMARKKYNEAIHGPTASEVLKDLDLSNKTCLITGANSGIGLEMTRALSARGCTVIMACRNKYAVSVTKNLYGLDERLRYYQTNLASFKSVLKSCNDIIRDTKNIDIVILNAGVFGLPWTLTEDMLETTFQVNFLSQFQLLMKIESILAPDARVVFVSSESHRNINWSVRDQVMPTEELVSLPSHQYTSIKAYNISKLCGLLAMHYLSYRWMKTAKGVFSAHPGSFVKTKLCRNWWLWEALYTAMTPFSKTISQAASIPLYCATSPDLNGLSGVYIKDLKRCEESELAKDFQLAFTIMDLAQELLSKRTDFMIGEGTHVEDRKKYLTSDAKNSIHDTLTPEYSS